MVYSYPKIGGYDMIFFRLGGAGLGNLLFPWARSIVAARNNDWTPVFPTWPQLKLGPTLRGELDKRAYSDLFEPTEVYASKFKKIRLFLGANKYYESDIKSEVGVGNDSAVILFSGIDGYFKNVKKDHKFVKSQLLNITREKHKYGFEKGFGDSICVHVRLQDFKEPDPGDLSSGPGPYRIPLEWHIEKIQQIREKLGNRIKVNVFSGSPNEELKPILDMKNVERKFFGSSIADMLALSTAGILIASNSTFSMWASYLGRMPAIWYPTQQPHPLYTENTELEVSYGYGEKLPKEFVYLTSEKLTSNVG